MKFMHRADGFEAKHGTENVMLRCDSIWILDEAALAYMIAVKI